MAEKCRYEGCEREVNPHYRASGFCIFHAPKDQKGVSGEEFNMLIDRQVNDNNRIDSCNFKGYNFPADINFGLKGKQSDGRSFRDTIYFDNAKFEGSVDFSGKSFSYDCSFNRTKFNDKINFNGCKFKKPVSFTKAQFYGNVDFIETQFSGVVDFIETQFHRDSFFSRAQFSKKVDFGFAQFFHELFINYARFLKNATFIGVQFTKNVDFIGTEFSGNAYFWGAQFYRNALFGKTVFSEKVSFKNALFSGDSYFYETKYSKNADFGSVEFLKNVFFVKTQFIGNVCFIKSWFSMVANFNEANFSRGGEFEETRFLGVTDFTFAKFSGNILFTDNTIGREILFRRILFEDKATFNFRNPHFLYHSDIKSKDLIKPKVVFDKVVFSPFTAYFENAEEQTQFAIEPETNQPVMIFNYCQLEDVYLTGNDLSLFKFFKSSFDKARFISCNYKENDYNKDRGFLFFLPYIRKNIIFEDRIFSELNTKETNAENDEKKKKKRTEIKKHYMLKDLNKRDEVASMYRRMKTSLDNTKDYEQSGWFYFNEYEMKRQALIDKDKQKGRLKYNLKRFFSKRLIYYWYKVFAGYGEKPLWSLIWFLLFTFGFSIWHFFRGFDVSNGNKINYCFTSIGNWWDKFSWSFVWDFFIAILYTISHALPTSFFSDIKPDCSSGDDLDFIMLILNSVILIILIIFTAIGLKRHFRRF